MNGGVAYALSFALLAGLVLVLDGMTLRLSEQVRQIGAVVWAGTGTVLVGVSVGVGIALSAPYVGLLIGVLVACGWVVAPLRFGPTDSSESGE